MGKLVYDRVASVELDDRVLAHLQIVIGIKLRRGDSFYFSWKDDQSVGDGRTTIWLHPGVVLLYKYYGSRPPRINPAWVHDLELSANTNTGLQIVPEPEHALSGHPA
ncbi:ATP-dependent DNA ligase [Frondihabitans australicus]|uniref:DUF7882 domain-containing protein n=1 Tax=Frondihabitans australicus TaxID=386892 RepID=A0A495IFJ5_9MICO|nr:ATP-dependent DNA ligase [Frondihabitans australicus]RKR74777.1 hypothetical protein C8E83_1906 [Frondihabitans australicus]